MGFGLIEGNRITNSGKAEGRSNSRLRNIKKAALGSSIKIVYAPSILFNSKKPLLVL
ncbi:hypothetical protein GCM10008934_23030 [Virgibacillus salarius]